VEYSETFGVSPWGAVAAGTASAPVITANDTTAPNGTMTADKVVFDTGAGTSGTDRCTIYQDILNQPIGIYTASIYAKVASGTAKIIMRSAGGGQYTTLNLTTEWQRFEVAETNSVFGTVNIEIGLRRGLANEPLTSPVTCYLWGAQLNIGSTAKPYFPTTDRLNVPRLTYQNGGGGCPSLLLEKQSTNYALWSEAFTNGVWATYNGTTTDNETISPDGTQNASKVIMGAGNSATIRQTIGGLSNGQPYTFSLYIKQGSGVTAFLDISDTASTVNITPTNEWVRYTYTANWNTTLNFIDIELRGTSGVAYCYIWGAQLE
jgi:hypothetical protein